METIWKCVWQKVSSLTLGAQRHHWEGLKCQVRLTPDLDTLQVLVRGKVLASCTGVSHVVSGFNGELASIVGSGHLDYLHVRPLWRVDALDLSTLVRLEQRNQRWKVCRFFDQSLPMMCSKFRQSSSGPWWSDASKLAQLRNHWHKSRQWWSWSWRRHTCWDAWQPSPPWERWAVDKVQLSIKQCIHESIDYNCQTIPCKDWQVGHKGVSKWPDVKQERR